MKVYEKINQLIEEKGLSLTALHQEIQKLFEENTVSYRTLLRTIHGETSLREGTLFQIASVLGKTPLEIRKDTDEEPKFTYFHYHKKAYLEFESTNLNFLVGNLVLLGGAKTESENDPIERGDFVKWLRGLQGELTCIVTTENGEERHIIKEGVNFYFHSTHSHCFENHTGKKAVCLLIQNPKYI